ncbi:MAG: hypothetical protein JJU19_16420 [Pararhodobacter sp.]|nr:hypothetical protein [Pararhodobacter sp.]
MAPRAGGVAGGVDGDVAGDPAAWLPAAGVTGACAGFGVGAGEGATCEDDACGAGALPVSRGRALFCATGLAGVAALPAAAGRGVGADVAGRLVAAFSPFFERLAGLADAVLPVVLTAFSAVSAGLAVAALPVFPGAGLAAALRLDVAVVLGRAAGFWRAAVGVLRAGLPAVAFISSASRARALAEGEGMLLASAAQ